MAASTSAGPSTPHLPVKYLLDGSLPTCPPLSSCNANLTFVAGPQLSLHIFDNATGSIVATLPTEGSCPPDHRIVALLQHPKQSHQILVVVSDGRVHVVDYPARRIAHTYSLGMDVSHAAVSIIPTASNNEPAMRLLIATEKVVHGRYKPDLSHLSARERARRRQAAREDWSREPDIRASLHSAIYMYDLHGAQDVSPRGRRLAKTKRATALSISPCGNWIGIVSGPRVIIVRLVTTNDPSPTGLGVQVVKLRAPESLTTIVFPPAAGGTKSPSYFATGSVQGRIALWHALFDETWNSLLAAADRDPKAALTCPTSILHWHAHAVGSLAFTPNAAYLASGGEEGVLVLWQLAAAGPNGSRQFLPRLGGPLCHIVAVDAEDSQPLVLVMRKDGDTLIVDTAAMRVVQTLPGPKRIGPDRNRNQAVVPMAYLYGHGECYFIVPSSTSSVVQIIGEVGSRANGEEIEIAPSNRISRRDERQVVDPVVSHVSLGGQGQAHMATVDFRPDRRRRKYHISQLKFWRRTSDCEFALFARIVNPHAATVSSVAITHTDRPVTVTTARDGSIKVWSMVPTGETTDTAVASQWSCVKSLSYRGYTALHATFNADESILAIVHKQCVSLWDVGQFHQLGVVAGGSKRLGSLQQAVFAGPDSRLLVSGMHGLGLFDLATRDQLAFWPLSPRVVVDSNGISPHVMLLEQAPVRSRTTRYSLASDELFVVDTRHLDRPPVSLGCVSRACAAVCGRRPATSDGDASPHHGLTLLTAAGSVVQMTGEIGSVSSKDSVGSDLPVQVDSRGLPSLAFPDNLLFSSAPTAIQTTPSTVLGMETADAARRTVDGVPVHSMPPIGMIWDSLLSLPAR